MTIRDLHNDPAMMLGKDEFRAYIDSKLSASGAVEARFAGTPPHWERRYEPAAREQTAAEARRSRDSRYPASAIWPVRRLRVDYHARSASLFTHIEAPATGDKSWDPLTIEGPITIWLDEASLGAALEWLDGTGALPTEHADYYERSSAPLRRASRVHPVRDPLDALVSGVRSVGDHE